MSLQRTARILRPTLSSRIASHTRFASSQQTTEKPQPKILSDTPPEKGQESEEVRKHNEEMDRRAERANAQVTQEDVEKDKVDKGYWSGGQAGDNKGGSVSGGSS